MLQTADTSSPSSLVVRFAGEGEPELSGLDDLLFLCDSFLLAVFSERVSLRSFGVRTEWFLLSRSSELLVVDDNFTPAPGTARLRLLVDFAGRSSEGPF